LNKLSALVTAILLLTVISTAYATEVPPDHPLLGTWLYDVPGLSCIETYDFKPDGTEHTISREEIGDNQFHVTTTADRLGYFTFQDMVITNNQKQDCGYNLTPIGNVISGFIIFDRSQQTMYLCTDRTQYQCTGPFVRSSTSILKP